MSKPDQSGKHTQQNPKKVPKPTTFAWIVKGPIWTQMVLTPALLTAKCVVLATNWIFLPACADFSTKERLGSQNKLKHWSKWHSKDTGSGDQCKEKQKIVAALHWNTSSAHDDYVFVAGLTEGHTTQNTATKCPKISLTIENSKATMLLDTGSYVNVIDGCQYEFLSANSKLVLTKTNPKIYAYGSDIPIKILVKFQITIEMKTKVTTATFYVVGGSGGSFLSFPEATKLA